MASDPETATYICDQVQGAGPVAARKMFGEYGLFMGGRMVALICGNQLFLKPLPSLLALLPEAALAAPYPGAKPHIRVDDALEDSDLMTRAFARLNAEVPEPKPKPKKPKKTARPG